jgi:hypothetical protein
MPIPPQRHSLLLMSGNARPAHPITKFLPILQDLFIFHNLPRKSHTDFRDTHILPDLHLTLSQALDHTAHSA